MSISDAMVFAFLPPPVEGDGWQSEFLFLNMGSNAEMGPAIQYDYYLICDINSRTTVSVSGFWLIVTFLARSEWLSRITCSLSPTADQSHEAVCNK